MKPNRAILAAVIAALLPMGWVLPAQAQRRGPQVRAGQLRGPGAGPLGRGRIPQNWMVRLQKMSPEQQERFLENNRRFLSLPPEQQARIRARLKQWNSLTPEQRQILIRRARIFQSMSPEERREIRQVILPEWRQLPPERRRVLVGKLQQLQGLNDKERREQLRDPNFVQGLSPDEQKLLEQLSKLKVGPGAGNL